MRRQIASIAIGRAGGVEPARRTPLPIGPPYRGLGPSCAIAVERCTQRAAWRTSRAWRADASRPRRRSRRGRGRRRRAYPARRGSRPARARPAPRRSRARSRGRMRRPTGRTAPGAVERAPPGDGARHGDGSGPRIGISRDRAADAPTGSAAAGDRPLELTASVSPSGRWTRAEEVTADACNVRVCDRRGRWRRGAPRRRRVAATLERVGTRARRFRRAAWRSPRSIPRPIAPCREVTRRRRGRDIRPRSPPRGAGPPPAWSPAAVPSMLPELDRRTRPSFTSAASASAHRAAGRRRTSTSVFAPRSRNAAGSPFASTT